MANTNGTKSSADLEREAQAQRDRIEARIGEIRERLSPGQLVDEVLSYTKDGGGKFVSNLGAQISANPIPAALVGIGLAWLMSGKSLPMPQMSGTSASFDDLESASFDDDVEEYPYARVPSGGLRRVSHAADEAGQWWSEFETDTGGKYRAASDSLGRRAGHFTDSAGKTFGGFIDDAGNRVRQFRDESGKAMDDTLGWARHSWRQVRRNVGQQLGGASTAMSQAMNGMSQTVDGVRGNVAGLTGTVQSQADQLSRQMTALFEQQPLVAGALAFAAGAALGASLPATKQEDQLLGEPADKLKRQASDAASQAYAEGKRQVSDAYEEVSGRAAELYGDAKDKLGKTAASDKTMH